jgi:hypothetical protein
MNAEQAWQSVLGQLQMEMPRASFDTWVRDTKPVSYQDETLTIGVRNAYARDWLESRLASTVSRLLVGILNASVSINFVVTDQNDDTQEEDDSSSDDDRNEQDTGVALQLEADQSSDYFMEVRPDHCVMIEGYHQRLCEKGDETLTDLSLYMGFRQAVFPAWKRAGEPVELVRTVSVRKILEFAMCIGRSKFFELLPGKEISSANKMIAGGHVEIKETRASTKEKFVDTNTYLVRMRPLLARVDATAVKNVIHERVAQTVEKDEARREALNALYDFLNCDIGKWLVETAGESNVDVSIPRTVAGIVEKVLGESLNEDLNKASDLLHEKIVNAFGMIKLTHYYIRVVVPTLHFSIAQSWAIAFARDRAWFDYKTMTQKDYVITPNGIADLARWVGVTSKIVKKWLEEDKYFKCFVAMVDPSHSPDEKNTFFVVNHLEPMLGEVFGGKHWRWDVRETVLDAMRLESRLEQDLPAREKEKLEQRINALRAKINEKLAQSNGKTWTITRKNVDYHAEKRGLPHGKTWTTMWKNVDHLMEKYGLSDGKIRTTLDSYIKPQFNPSPALKSDKTNSTPTMQPTKNSLGMLRAKGVGEPDFSSFDWSLEGLLKQNRTSQIKRKEIRALQISFEGLLALTLYWGGITGQRRGIQNPYSYALSDLTTEVPDEYIDLAKLPPKEIFAHLVGGDRGRFASEIEWNRLIGDNAEYREKLLTTLFGIEFPERHPSEVVIRTTQITRPVD